MRVGVLVSVAVGRAVRVDVDVGAGVGVSVGRGVRVGSGVLVAVGSGVRVGAGDAVGVLDAVGEAVGVLVKIVSRQTGHESSGPVADRVWSYPSKIFTYRTPGNCFSMAMMGCARLCPLPVGLQVPARYTVRTPFENSTLRYPAKPLFRATRPRDCSSIVGPAK